MGPSVAPSRAVGKRHETLDERAPPVRPAVRVAMAVVSTIAVTVPLTGAAVADPRDPGYPSQQRIEKAQKDVADKQRSVAAIQGAMAAAQSRLLAAGVAAEHAAEAYNGARWRLQVAHEASAAAKQREADALQAVERQRSSIVTLVTESYQNGTELNTATALVTDEGPEGMMNRYAVVQSAGDSMQAAYDRFRAVSAEAKDARAQAARAEKKQKALAAEARDLAVQASDLAMAASAAAAQINEQKQQLVQELAKAENTTLELATQRQAALQRIAERKAAAAARAKEVAEQAALRKAAAAARKDAKKADSAKPDLNNNRPGDEEDTTGIAAPVPAPPMVFNPAPNQEVAVKRAIAYAEQQIGKPYQWAAAGPGTFDCSGLTMQAWAAGGKLLPHYSVAQFYQSTRISMKDAKPGDLLFWSNNGSPSGIHHVALYIGDGEFIEAPYTGATVRYNTIGNWFPDFVARP